MEEKYKLYSQKAIAISTFFGGPLAAGVLIRRNALNLGHEKQGLYALIIGIVSSILLFFGIFQFSEATIEKIPNALLPAIYTAVIYFIVAKLQGKELNAHSAKNGLFYSNWKAGGIGAVCMAIILTVALSGIYLSEEKWDIDQYNAYVVQYGDNEQAAGLLFDKIDTLSDEEILQFIEIVGIPKWNENIKLIQEMDAIPNIPAEQLEYNKQLLEYSQLGIAMFELMAKSIVEETEDYDDELKKIEQRMFALMEFIKE